MTNQNPQRDSFIFYRSFYQSFKKLSKEDKAEIFDAICSYALDGELIELSIVPEAIFTVIQPQLDANRRKWENGCKEKKKDSKDETNPEHEESKPEAKDKQSESKPEGNVNDNVNGNEKCKSKSKDFISPTLQEVKDYCFERKNSVDPQKFFDYYSASNWKDKDGKQVKIWKQKVISWEGRNKSDKPVQQDHSILCQEINRIIGENIVMEIKTDGDKAMFTILENDWDNLIQNNDIRSKIKDKLFKEIKTISIYPNYIQ